MEGAEAHVVGSAPDQTYIIADHLYDVGGILDALRCGLVDHRYRRREYVRPDSPRSRAM